MERRKSRNSRDHNNLNGDAIGPGIDSAVNQHSDLKTKEGLSAISESQSSISNIPPSPKRRRRSPQTASSNGDEQSLGSAIPAGDSEPQRRRRERTFNRYTAVDLLDTDEDFEEPSTRRRPRKKQQSKARGHEPSASSIQLQETSADSVLPPALDNSKDAKSLKYVMSADQQSEESAHGSSSDEDLREVVDDEWINTGQTKDDDDRVLHEVKRRHEVAKKIFKTVPDKIPVDSRSRLERLLDQSNQYTAYMLAQSLAPYDGDYDDVAAPDTRRSASMRRKEHSGDRRLSGRRRARDDTEELKLLQEADAELTGQQRFWTRLTSQPASITGGTLKPYQLEGLNWLIHLYESGLNGILADEMGLGKTLQTISLLAFLKESRNISGPYLILAPKSTLGNWFNEIARFCPSLKAYKFHGTKDQRAEDKAKGYLKPNAFDIIITSYELCMKEQQLFRKFRFRYIVVDEAHRIKNEASKLSQVVRQFKTQFRLLLTGTPLQNNLRELWALLNFLFPEMFECGEEFDRLFDLTGTTEEVRNLTVDEKTERNAEVVSRLHKILKPFLLRRVKSEVMTDLPPKKEMLLYIPLSALQRSLYKDLLSRNVDAMHDISGGGRVRLLNLAMQLRKACNHPYLFEGYEDKSLDPFGEHLVFNSGKMLLIDRLLQRLISRGSRTLIFTQMTRMLDILEDYCRLREFSYCRLDGSTLGEERERQLEEFNSPGSPHSVFLLSTRAGGLGINLATADTVVLFDSDWNPQVDLQAMDRAHRIGQKNPVNIYRFVHQHTIEEKIIERASLKLKLDTAVIQQGRLSDQQRQLGKGELLRMIQFGADQIFKSKDAADMTDEDVEAILSRGERHSQELSSRLESHLKKSMLNFDSSFAAPSLYEFEGIDYEPQKDRQAWAEMGVNILEEERNAKRKVRVMQEQLEALQRQQIGATSVASADSKIRNKLLKLPRMEDWQFYRRDRIHELHELEVQYASGLGDEPLFEEREEKQQLLSEGFGDWTRKDLLTFIKSCETVGISEIKQISKDVGKPEKEVERYIATFLERFSELAEGEKLLARVRQGDSVNAKRKEVEEILAHKLCEERLPWRRLFVKFPKSKTHFTDEEDSWLLNAVHAIGYGNWVDIQLAINRDPHWTFDWFLRSRSPQDLARRVEFLVRQLQRETQEEAPSGTRSKARTALDLSERASIALKERGKAPMLFPSPKEMYGNTRTPMSLVSSPMTSKKGKIGLKRQPSSSTIKLPKKQTQKSSRIPVKLEPVQHQQSSKDKTPENIETVPDACCEVQTEVLEGEKKVSETRMPSSELEQVAPRLTIDLHNIN